MIKPALLAVFGIVAVMTSCTKPQALQYVDLANLQVSSKNFIKPVVSADVRFYNPNGFTMKMKRAEMDVSVNNKFIGHSLLDSTIDIPKLDTFSIPVKLNVDLKTMVVGSLSALLNDEVDLGITGTAKLGKAGIYRSFPFTYQGKQKLRLFQ